MTGVMAYSNVGTSATNMVLQKRWCTGIMVVDRFTVLGPLICWYMSLFDLYSAVKYVIREYEHCYYRCIQCDLFSVTCVFVQAFRIMIRIEVSSW